MAELSGLESFDKDRLKVLIDKVIVYGGDAIEIVWKVENPFQKREANGKSRMVLF